MRILFLCPTADKINGGIKYIFRMAEALRADGHDAVVFEKNSVRPHWFPSTAPLVNERELQPRADEIIVLPEDQPDVLRTIASWPQQKIIYCQNHFYAAIGAQGAHSFANFGVKDILCSSKTIMDYCAERHPGTRLHHIPCSVDPHVFKPGTKTRSLALIPRKRPVEAAFLQDKLIAQSSTWRDIEWISLHNTDENAIAESLGRAAVFLSLSRLDGFGLTPIEAMASGCVVAGFTGIGGREYATPNNGFWAEEDDLPGCYAALTQALAFWSAGGKPLEDYRQATQKTADRYTPDAFTAAVREAWNSILKSRNAA